MFLHTAGDKHNVGPMLGVKETHDQQPSLLQKEKLEQDIRQLGCS